MPLFDVVDRRGGLGDPVRKASASASGAVTSPGRRPSETRTTPRRVRIRVDAERQRATCTIAISFRGPTFMKVSRPGRPGGRSRPPQFLRPESSASARPGSQPRGKVRVPSRSPARQWPRRRGARERVPGRRCRSEVPADRAAVPDLRRADRPRCLGQRRQRVRELGLHQLGVGGPAPSRMLPFRRDQPRSSSTFSRLRKAAGGDGRS